MDGANLQADMQNPTPELSPERQPPVKENVSSALQELPFCGAERGQCPNSGGTTDFPP